MRGPCIRFMASVLMAVPAAAETCVGPAFDRPFPGAVDVSIHQADVRSAQFPGIWQSGTIEGQFYQIFANKVAVLRSERSSAGWSITVDCQRKPCANVASRKPPEFTKAIAKKIEQCLAPENTEVKPPQPAKIAKHEAMTAGSAQSAVVSKNNAQPKKEMPTTQKPPDVNFGKSPDNRDKHQAFNVVGRSTQNFVTPHLPTAGRSSVQAETKPKFIELEGFGEVVLTGKPFLATTVRAGEGSKKPAAVTLAQNGSNAPGSELVCLPVSRKKPMVAAHTCGLAKVPYGSPTATLQQLLVLAGANPGEIDGTFGSLTENALHQVLGNRSDHLNLYEAIVAVNASLCNK